MINRYRKQLSILLALLGPFLVLAFIGLWFAVSLKLAALIVGGVIVVLIMVPAYVEIVTRILKS